MTRTLTALAALLLAAALPAADKPDRHAGAKKAINDAIAVLERQMEKETEPAAKYRLRTAIRELNYIRDMEVLTPEEELARFAADPAKQKGKWLTLPLVYVGTAPLADRVGQEKVEFEGTYPGAKKPVRVLVDIPKQARVSADGGGRGVAVLVLLHCRDGRLDAGNVAESIWEK